MSADPAASPAPDPCPLDHTPNAETEAAMRDAEEGRVEPFPKCAACHGSGYDFSCGAASPAGGPAPDLAVARQRVINAAQSWLYDVGNQASFTAELDSCLAAVAAHHRAEGERLRARIAELERET